MDVVDDDDTDDDDGDDGDDGDDDMAISFFRLFGFFELLNVSVC